MFLFDEPLSNLDAKLRVQMRLELQQLHRRLKTTSLYVTHDQVEAMTLPAGDGDEQRRCRTDWHAGGGVRKTGQPFCGEFIGSPAMNLLEGRISSAGTHFELESGDGIAINCTIVATPGVR
ncbi:hypothetical protein KIF59_22215 [Enterobacter cloacae subsp. cloacae]|nr:hypothetical protein [Enterobacter cloacae subsp. cloacae]